MGRRANQSFEDNMPSSATREWETLNGSRARQEEEQAQVHPFGVEKEAGRNLSANKMDLLPSICSVERYACKSFQDALSSLDVPADINQALAAEAIMKSVIYATVSEQIGNLLERTASVPADRLREVTDDAYERAWGAFEDFIGDGK